MEIYLKRSPNFQLGLKIERGFDRRAPPLSASYQVVKNGLRENIGDRYILYGLWNRLFGCWMVSAKNPTIDHQEIVPRWPILLPARDRVQADQMSVLRHLKPFPDRQVVLGKKSNLHFSQYLDAIPTVMQNLCRPFGSGQWLALDVIRQVQGFMWFLLGERQEGRLGYVAACLAGFFETGRHDRKLVLIVRLFRQLRNGFFDYSRARAHLHGRGRASFSVWSGLHLGLGGDILCRASRQGLHR